MATAVRTARVLQASATNAAAATTNSSELDLSTTFGGLLTAKVTNGGTGPTLGCDVVIEVSANGGTTWYETMRVTGGTVANTAYSWGFVVSDAMRVRVTFTGNTGQGVTIEAVFHEFTSAA